MYDDVSRCPKVQDIIIRFGQMMEDHAILYDPTRLSYNQHQLSVSRLIVSTQILNFSFKLKPYKFKPENIFVLKD